MPALTLLFFLTAAIYAAVGFGGGSTYTALLAAANTDYRLIPILSLLCNLLVVSGGILHARRAGGIDIKAARPFLLTSVPFAFLGGLIPIPENAFLILLSLALLISGIRLLSMPSLPENPDKFRALAPLPAWSIGCGLGFLAGLVGIGGGIFLAPLLYFLRWGSARKIAATCSLFILFNSLAGLLGQGLKLSHADLGSALFQWWPLLLAVVLGGQIGSFLSMNRFSGALIRRLTGAVILVVVVRLALQLWE